MFGLEKGKGKELMEFELETELREDPKKAKEKLAHVEAKISEIKTKLREGSEGKGFEQLGVLLHGYTALQRVLTRVVKQ